MSMLIIGHRGAAGLKPENTLESLHAAMDADADIIEFDIRLTRDGIPVLNHDFHTFRANRKVNLISRLTLDELRTRTAESTKPIVTLEEALDTCFGKVMLNIELKHRGCGDAAIDVLKKHFIARKRDWHNILFSSFSPYELRRIRKRVPSAALALLHGYNPFVFVAFQRQLKLAAVGFHRLYINPFALEIAQRTGLFTYAYTVNRPGGALHIAQQGIDAVVTDYPDKIHAAIKKYQS